jgi:predicted dehydrogenase
MNVAVLGLGFMGATHAKAWGSVRGARLAGVMSSNPAKLAGDLTSVGGNLGSAAERLDFGEARRFTTIESVLADPGIDAVDICLPTDLHAEVAISALRAGKHVLVEKPMALDYASAKAVCAEAERCGRILMAAQVLRFIPAYRRLAQWAQSRRMQEVVFRRQCGKPAWLTDISRSGGAVLDLLIHDIDFCISLWGMPDAVSAKGTGDLIRAEAFYPERKPVVIEGGWHQEPEFPFSMEYEADELRWSSADSEPDTIDSFAAELQYFADCINLGQPPDFCPPEQSAQAVALARFILESRDNNGKLVRTS